MPATFRHFRLEYAPADSDSAGSVTVWIDVAGRSVNAFGADEWAEFGQVLDELESLPASTSLFFRSAKPSGFHVGADLKRIVQLQTADEAQAFLATGQRGLERLNCLPQRTVAVMEGACLGGGVEFTLGCHYRWASTAGAVQLGMPEVKLGLIPGWGATQRLPRLIGVRRALRMLLTGDSVSVETAHRWGLVDQVFSPAGLAELCDTFSHARVRPVDYRPQAFAVRDRRWWWWELRRWERSGPLTPAQQALLTAVRKGWTDSFQDGLAAELDEFGKILFLPETRQRLSDFFQKRHQQA